MKIKLRPPNEKLYKQALDDVNKALAGKPSSYTRVTLPQPVSKEEVKATRRFISVTQRKFAETVGVSLETVKAWESGKRIPEGPATKIIRMLRQDQKLALTLAKI